MYDRPVAPQTWFNAYTTAYLERDVRQITKVQDLEAFHRFVRLCAGRTGQLLNFTSLASECGITHNTAKSWISVLEASYIVFLLQPHHKNFNKRVVVFGTLGACLQHPKSISTWYTAASAIFPENTVRYLVGKAFRDFPISEESFFVFIY